MRRRFQPYAGDEIFTLATIPDIPIFAGLDKRREIYLLVGGQNKAVERRWNWMKFCTDETFGYGKFLYDVPSDLACALELFATKRGAVYQFDTAVEFMEWALASVGRED